LLFAFGYRSYFSLFLTSNRQESVLHSLLRTLSDRSHHAANEALRCAIGATSRRHVFSFSNSSYYSFSSSAKVLIAFRFSFSFS
jgi:hypothetical protein